MGQSPSKIPNHVVEARLAEFKAFKTNGTKIVPSTTISCEKGDISTFSAPNGAVINAANGALVYGGTAKALREAGGDALETESQQLMAAYSAHNIRHLPAGAATVTGAGNMKNYKKIIQAVGPVVRGRTPSPEERYRLYKAYEQVFRVAALYGLQRLIIPFLSIGQFAFEMKEGMKIALFAVLNTLPGHGIKEIVFVCNEDSKVDNFKKIALGKLPLKLHSRPFSEHLLKKFCSGYKIPIDSTLKCRIDKEMDDLFDVTRRILRISVSAPIVASPAAVPQNPITSLAVSSDAIRMREARAKESQEEYQARLDSQRERDRTRRAVKSAEEKEKVKEADRRRKAASRNKVKESHEERARMEADRLRERRERAAAEEKEMKLQISQRKDEDENSEDSDTELGQIRKSLPFPDFSLQARPINTSPCTTPPPEPVPDLKTMIQELSLVKSMRSDRHGPWLLLTNLSRTDGFLNASLQFLRRMRGIDHYVNEVNPFCKLIKHGMVKESQKERTKAFEKFLEFLERFETYEENGKVHGDRTLSTSEFREMLFEVLPDLKPDLLSSQQDPCEIISKIFHHLLPECLYNHYSITIGNWKRCRDRVCSNQPTFVSGLPINLEIREMNQVLDLEDICSDEWKLFNEDDKQKTHHCESCCPCCIAHQSKFHDYEQCKKCERNNAPYTEAASYSAENAYTRDFDSQPFVYAVLLFNIVQQNPPRRLDWQLSENCNLQDLKMMGHRWKAVAIICHGGDPAGGHYSCYTNENFGEWYLHNDHVTPNSIGKTFHPNPEGRKDMQGVTAILFEKIDKPYSPVLYEFELGDNPEEELEEEEYLESEELKAILKRRDEWKNENPVIFGYQGSRRNRPLAPPPPPPSQEPAFPRPRLPKRNRLPSPDQDDDGWIRLKNKSGTDCFLNASIQCLRSFRELSRALHDDKKTRNQSDRLKEGVLTKFDQLISKSGTFSTVNFRRSLRGKLKDLPRDFLYTQQDAGEIILKIFHDLLPTDVSNKYLTQRVVWRRCRDNLNGCKKKPRIESVGPLVCHITEMNQVLDLEAAFSDQVAISYDDEDAMHHCEFCCKCCIARAGDPNHDSDHCEECKANNNRYTEFDKYEFEGELNDVLIVFNILQHDPPRKLDWAIKKCDLQNVNMLGYLWRLQSIVQHQGDADGGHYRCFTVKDWTDFFLHNDADEPVPCGDFQTFKLPDSHYKYPNDAIDMKGVTAMTFARSVFAREEKARGFMLEPKR